MLWLVTTGKANIWLKRSKAGDFLDDMRRGQNLWLSGKHIGKMSVPYCLHGFVTIFMAWFLGIVVFVSPLSFCIYMNVNEGTSYYDETIFYFYSTYTPSLHPKNSTFLTFSTFCILQECHWTYTKNCGWKMLEDLELLETCCSLHFCHGIHHHLIGIVWASSNESIYLSIEIDIYIFNQPSKK